MKLKPLPIIENGRLKVHNLKFAGITKQDVQDYLKQHGIKNISEVGRLDLEISGEFELKK